MSSSDQRSPVPASSPGSAGNPIKSRRILACVLCQQRKVKCDRQFPCNNCRRSGSQCVPADQNPRERRRRFAERDLLNRLRNYESLLRQNNIEFQPLHSPPTDINASHTGDDRHHGSSDGQQRCRTEEPRSHPNDTPSVKPGTVYEPSDFWQAMSPNPRALEPEEDSGNDDDDDDGNMYPHEIVRKEVVRGAWAQMSQSINRSLFGFGTTDVDLGPFHPPQVQIFRLWHIYLENVNPLLAVTHTPTLQSRILDAVSNMTSIEPPLEALMLSIYCVSILSLSKEDCQALFGVSRDNLLKSYQFGCEQALLKCDVLRTDDIDCLTAFYLYLISFRPGTDPRSVSSMLGIAVRIAQRLGIHNESANAKCSVLDAEMRRRLWWSLVIFDHRICELSDYKTTMLSPVWDCKTPLNISDLDIRAEMTSAPAPHDYPCEALFAVVRSEMSDFLRHSAFHLDYTNPALKALTNTTPPHQNDSHDNELTLLERLMEEKYLRHCNPENPLHFMTIWWTRGHLARNRLLDYHARHSSSSVTASSDRSSNTTTATASDSQSSANSARNPKLNPNPSSKSRTASSSNLTIANQMPTTRSNHSFNFSSHTNTASTATTHNDSHQHHDQAITYAMRMLECDTALITSPLTKGYTWYMHNYFPFPAYIHIVRNLERRPMQPHADEAWSVMSDNYDGRFSDVEHDANPLFKVFSGAILQAWNARVAATACGCGTRTGSGEDNVEGGDKRYAKRKRNVGQNQSANEEEGEGGGRGGGEAPCQHRQHHRGVGERTEEGEEEKEKEPRIVVKIKRKLAELQASSFVETMTATANITDTNTQPGPSSAQDGTTTTPSAPAGTINPTTMQMQAGNMCGGGGGGGGDDATFTYGANGMTAGLGFPGLWDTSSSPGSSSTGNYGRTMPGPGMGWFDYGPLDWSTTAVGWNPTVSSRGW